MVVRRREAPRGLLFVAPAGESGFEELLLVVVVLLPLPMVLLVVLLLAS